MMNIPTDLLRTLVAVVDQRSFTRAAQSLKVTQPAVSAQVKRLQSLLGYDVLDKRTPGVSLTSRGEIVVSHARRLLAINDDILQFSGPSPAAQTLRIGIQGDYAATRLPGILARFHRRWPEVRFKVTGDSLDQALRDLDQRELDLLLTMTVAELPMPTEHLWAEEAVWVRSKATDLDALTPVPLISYGYDCICNQLAASCLQEANMSYDIVFMSRSLLGLIEAVDAGLGVMVLPRARVARANLIPWDDGPLPKPTNFYCGIYLREGDDRAALDALAGEIALEFGPRGVATPEPSDSVVAPVLASRVG
jgi:DNA-binding transcriptional LysR family regulator